MVHMKTTSKLLIGVLIFGLLAGCGQPAGTPATQKSFYLLSATKPETADTRKIGCEEYLVPITKGLSKKSTLEEVVKKLLEADPKEYGDNLLTATAFTDKYIKLDSVNDPEKPTATDPVRVRLVTATTGGIAGVCDVPRIKEQITETVRKYAESKSGPYQITLNGNIKNWECLGNESGFCKK